ncbi:hypothetical protein GcM3_179011 [Golovinomyces cichoracearum]|uniref:GAR domain-containing protein n=1 Tax=Golovinomyces cichoracearum TaxID=62708 RepID=A0A420HN75_9PEZI|nr:hypothetical protein GcM3_179011 [Golovinomyces cichoracearum]
MSQPFSNPVSNQIAQTSYSENQSRSYSLQHELPNDILFDLTPSKTLEALTSSSSRLSESIESISPSERAFGIRAAVASKKIHEWLEELSLWQWPKNGGSAVFGTISAKHRQLYTDEENFYKLFMPSNGHRHNYADCLADLDISQYENRLDEILNDMQDLQVDEIKRQVLETHIIARSGPSSSFFSSPISNFFSSTSYTKMDDFSAIVIATVLQALPKLSRLVSLIEIWSRRLFILKKIPKLLLALEDAEIALDSGWNTVKKLGISESSNNAKNPHVLSRETFDVMKYVFEEKVTTLGQSLDFMLNILEGSQDTLPDSWLDRMERIEKEYGEWVVTCDSIVRRGELHMSDNSHNFFRNSFDKEEENEILSSKSESDSKIEGNCTPEYSSVASELVQPKTHPESLGLTKQKGSAQLESVRALPKLTLEEETQDPSPNSTAKAESNEIIKARNSLTSTNFCKKGPVFSSLEPESVEYDFKQKSSLAEKNQSIIRTDNHSLKSPKSKQELNSEKGSSIINEQILNHKLAESSSENDSASTVPKSNKDFNDEIKSEISKNCLSDACNQHQHSQAVSEKPKLDNPSVSCNKQSLSNSINSGQAFCLSSKFSRLDSKMDELSFLDGSDKCQIYPIADSADDFNVGEFDLDQIKELKPVKLDAISLHSESLSRNKLRRDIFDGQKIHISEVSPTLNTITLMPNGPVPRCSSLNSSDSSSTSLSCDLHLDEKYDIMPSAILNLTNPILEYINDSSLEIENLVSPTPVHLIENEKTHCSDSSFLYLDGCSESHLVYGVDTDDDNLNFTRIVPCPSQNQRPRSKDLLLVNKNQSEITKSHGLTFSEDSIDDSVDINLELVENSPINLSSSTFKIILKGEAGKKYSIELPCDGTTIYTNNPICVSTICSDFNVPALCDITSKGRTPSFISGSSGVFKIIPPQIIFSITYRALPISTLKAENPRLESDPFMEKNSTKNSCFTRCISEDTTKEIPQILTLLQSGQILNRSKISPVMEEETNFPPPLSEASVAYNDCYINSVQNQKFSSSSSICKSTSTSSNKSPYLSAHQNSTSSDFAEFIAESSLNSPPYENSPITEEFMKRKLLPSKELSPLNEQDKHIGKNCLNLGPPESPILKIQKLQSTSFDPESARPPKNRINPNLQCCKTSPISKVNSSDGAQGIKDDQFQQQISSLLETIPSLVCLSTESEPKTLGPEILRSRETRSISNYNRSSSSQSNHGPSHREPTPPFTLIPAHGKGMSRQRHQNSNSEIRIYHLSRSNGEAPIKLFVRLVGEHGERVMVRVGGGWADLGEYLREYASHHCRRTDTDTIKIQDTPSRKSSMGTLKSSSTNRETRCSSPLQRPQSVIGEMQRNSLRVQKTRRSTGATSAECLLKQSRAGSNSRCPSTPLPVIKHISYDTPPSASSSSGTVASVSAAGTSGKSSHMSWTEEEFNLGLAGPRSKKSFISDRDQEWVESMQEKVRLASAEKDKRNRGRAGKLDKQRTRGLSLDGMERIGSTIRLFRRDGSAA